MRSLYTPLFNRILDSSIWMEAPHVRLTFITMMVKRDADDVVRGSAFNIARWANLSEEEVLDALKVLSSPDGKRLEPQAFEGRRIERREDGWFLINGPEYRKLMAKEAERASKARWARDHRAEEKEGKPAVKQRKGKPTRAESVAAKVLEAGGTAEEASAAVDGMPAGKWKGGHREEDEFKP